MKETRERHVQLAGRMKTRYFATTTDLSTARQNGVLTDQICRAIDSVY